MPNTMIYSITKDRVWWYGTHTVFRGTCEALEFLSQAAQYEQYPHHLARFWQAEWQFALDSTAADPTWPEQRNITGCGKQVGWRHTITGQGDRMYWAAPLPAHYPHYAMSNNPWD